jgi:hypothetical protein
MLGDRGWNPSGAPDVLECRMRAIVSRECLISMMPLTATTSSKCDEKWVTTLEERYDE